MGWCKVSNGLGFQVGGSGKPRAQVSLTICTGMFAGKCRLLQHLQQPVVQDGLVKFARRNASLGFSEFCR